MIKDLLVHGIGTLISNIIFIIVCKKMTNKKINISIVSVIIILLCSILLTFNTIFNYTMSKLLICIIVLFILYKLLFKTDVKQTLYSVIIIYFLLLIIEVILSVIFVVLPINDIKSLNDNILLKNLLSCLELIILLMIVSIKRINSFINNIINKSIKYDGTLLLFSIFLLILVFSSITFSRVSNLNSIYYWIFNSLSMIICIIVIAMLIKEKLLLKKTLKKQDTLLSFIEQYEKVIDKDRINRHEMLNNLLILKSYPDKKSDEYTKIIDDLINVYNNKTTQSKRNLYNLPSGLKGIIFFKLLCLENKKIKVVTNISKEAVIKFNSITGNLYTKICNIIGILLDNAIEAASDSKLKEILLDIYIEDEDIIFYLENSYNGTIDFEKINNFKYSSKGENRGFGLFVVKNILQKYNNIKLEQFEKNNHFVSILKIKIK